MIYVNWIQDLIKYGVKRNRNFLKALYEEDNFVKVEKWFDYLNCSKSWQRQSDKKMTLEKFLSLIDENSIIHLGVAYPDPDRINYSVNLIEKSINRFIFIKMPYHKKNFKLVSKIYKNSFEKNLEKEKVEKWIKKEYERMIRKPKSSPRK
jgi:hypothetical protein